eukprot:3740913-Rhodomonas_salina.1
MQFTSTTAFPIQPSTGRSSISLRPVACRTSRGFGHSDERWSFFKALTSLSMENLPPAARLECTWELV